MIMTLPPAYRVPDTSIQDTLKEVCTCVHAYVCVDVCVCVWRERGSLGEYSLTMITITTTEIRCVCVYMRMCVPAEYGESVVVSVSMGKTLFFHVGF